MNKIASIPALVVLCGIVYLVGFHYREQPDLTSPPAKGSKDSSAAQGNLAELGKFDALPTAITHRETGPGEHSYEVTGLYNPLNKDDSNESFASIYRNIVPHCTGFTVNYPRKTCAFTTSRELEIIDLADAMDEMARLGGEIPAFEEMQARDLPASTLANEVSFSVLPDNGETSGNLDWVRMPEQGELRQEVTLGRSGKATLLIVPATAHCMVHSRFVIRFLDEQGSVIWKETEIAYGTIEFAIPPATGDEGFKMFLHRNNHGMEDDFLFQQVAASSAPAQ